jgi:hypothetical protein
MAWCILSLASSFILIPRPLQHKAVLEGVVGNFDLSGEQLEEMAAVVKKKQRAYMKAYSTECHQRARLEDPVGVRERQRVNQANFEKNSWTNTWPDSNDTVISRRSPRSLLSCLRPCFQKITSTKDT